MRNHLIRYLTMLLMLICSFSTSWATETTTSLNATTYATAQGWTSNQDLTSAIAINSDISIAFVKNTGTQPVYNNSGKQFRVYQANTVTVSTTTTNCKITKIEFTATNNSIGGGSESAANVGSMSYPTSGKNSTWEKASTSTGESSVTITQPSGSGVYLTNVVVYYDDGSGTGGTGGGTGGTGGSGNSVTFDFTKQNYSMALHSGNDNTYNARPHTCTESPVSLVLDDGNFRLWNSNGTITLKHYKDCTFTFSVPTGYNITKIKFNGSNIGKVDGQPGTFSSNTWTGSSQSVQFKATQSSGGKDITTIEVEYTAPDTPEPAALAGKPVFTMDGVALTDDAYEVEAGTAVTVSSENATQIKLVDVDNVAQFVSNPYTFNVNDYVYYEAWGVNADNVLSEESTTKMFSLIPDTSVKQPVVTIGGVAQTDNASITVDKGTAVYVTAENANKVRYTINGSTLWTGVDKNTHTVTLTEEGTYRFYGLDANSNEGPTFTLTVSFNKPAAPVFSPVAGAVVSGTKVTVTCSGADRIYYRINSNESYGLVPASGLNVTEPTSFTAWGAKVTTVNGTEYETFGPEATASYTIVTPPSAPVVFTPAGGADADHAVSVEKGTTITISCADAEKISYMINGGDVVEESVDENHSINVQLNTEGAVEIYAVASISGVSGSVGDAFYTVTAPPARHFKLVTNENEIVNGKKYIIVSTKSGSGKAVDNTPVTDTSLGSVDVTVTDNTVTVAAGSSVGVFTMEAGYNGNNHSFKYASGEYLGITKADNKGFGHTSSKSANTTFTVTLEGTNKWLKMLTNGRMTRYYSSSSVSDFRSYEDKGTNTSGTAVYLFVEYSATEPGKATFSKTGALIGEGDAKDNDAVTVTSQNATHIKYTINGGTTETVEATDGVATLPAIEQNCTIEAWGFNSATNEEGAHETATFTVVYAPTDADLPTFSKQGGSNLPYNSKVTITGVAGCTLEVSTDDVNYETVTSPYTYTLKSNVTLYARSRNAAGVTEPVSYTFNVVEPEGKVYHLMIDDEDFEDGMEFLIVSKAGTKVMGKDKGAYAEAVAVTVTNNEIKLIPGEAPETQIYPFKLVAIENSNNWAIQLVATGNDAGKYISNSTSFEYSDSPVAFGLSFLNANPNNTDPTSEIAVQFAGDNTTYRLRYNPGDPRFRPYVETNDMEDVNFYVLGEKSTTKPKQAAFNKSGQLFGDGDLKNNNTVTVTSERATHIKYKIDGGDTQTIVATDGVATLPDIAADCTIEAWGYNQATEEEGRSATANFTVVYKPTEAPTYSVSNDNNVDYKSTVVLTAPEGCSIQYSEDGSNWTEVENPFTYTFTHSVTLYSRSVNVAGVKETSVTYVMNEPAKSVYTLVTSNDELEEGQMYLVVAAKEPGDTYAMPYASNATAQEAKGYAVTIDNDNTITLIDVDTDVAVFEMAKGVGNEDFALKYADGKYMVLTNSNNTNGITSGGSNDGSAKLSISIDSSNAQATIEGVSSTRKIRFNTAGKAFRVYTNNANGTVPVYLFALSNENKVLKPTLTVTGDKDLEGNYINAVTLVSEPVTEGSTVMYNSSLEPGVWNEVPQNWSLNTPQTITVKAVKESMDESFTRTATLTFRPATVDFVSSSDAQTGIMTITMSTETYGATIMYREGESGTWTEYGPSNPPTFEGDVVGLQAKAVYEPYAPLSESKIMTFGQRGDMVFELVTSADQLREGDEIVFVNYIPHSNQRTSKPEGAKDEPTSEPSYYAMTSDVYSNKHHRARRVEVIPNSEEEGRRQIIIPGGEDFAIFTLQKWTNDPNEPRPWMLQIDIEGESKYCASSVAEGSTAAAKMDFIGLPEQEKRHFVQTLLRIGTRNDYSEYTGFYWNNGLPGYNSTEASKRDLDDCATIVVGGEGKKASVARFNPAGNDVHFNFYGFDEDNDKPNETTWPVQIYRSTKQVLRPSITVYPKEVSYADGTYTEEWSDQSLAPEALPFYNPVKIVITENPRTKAGATLNYYWAKNETQVPVAEEYAEKEGTEVKGADMTVYVDGFDLWYYDDRNVEHRLDNYFLGNNPEDSADTRVKTNQTGYMSSTLFSISMLDGQSSPNTHRNVMFETTEPVLEKVEGGVQVHRPDVFTKGAVLYYTDDGTQPTVTYDEDGNIISFTGTKVNPEEVIQFDNGVLTVGAFKYGYKPNYATYSNLTVYPYVQPVQLLQLNTQAVKDIIEASAEVSDEEKAALGYTEALEAIANQADHEVMTNTYLTYRTGAGDKYYMLAYTVDSNDDIETITIVDVDDNAAKTVIKNPHLFKWTTDYYVFGMRLDEFESKVPFYKNDEEYRPVMLVTDGEDEVRVKPTVLRLNENGSNEENITYYGAVFRRHGSLGQTYFRTNFTYKAKATAEDEWQEFTDLRSYTRVVPNVPKPFDLSFRYEAERDDAFFMDPDWVEIEEAVLDEDNNVVTPAKRGFKFSSKGTATSEGRSLVGTSIPDLDVENDLYFREEDFALRKFNCVFSFHRPNISDEILDNYDIVYDIEVITGGDLPENPRHNYVDPLKSDEIDYVASNMDDHDAVNRYEFTVNNVYPLSTINPELVIRNVTYIPNDAESDLSQLIANYSGETVAEGETPLADFTQNIVAPNVTKASETDVKFEMAWFPQEDGKYGWELLQHTELDNSGNLIHYDKDNADNNVELEAPFMYHLEAYYPGNDVLEAGDNHYFSHPYLIGHDRAACRADRKQNENFVDPFYKIVVGQNYRANVVNGKLLVNSPKIYLTPIYMFYRNPQPTVTNEDALYLYTEYLENGGSRAPKRTPQRAEAPAQALSRNDIVIVRGTAYGTDEITNPDDNVMTDVDKLAQDGIRQEGNNLILPQGAKLYDTSGLQMRPEGLPHGIYLVRLADGRTVKVAVK